MPRGDRTGPTGMGAMSGRGNGYCAGAEVPGFANRMPGRAFGMGAGRGRGFGGGGRGWRHMSNAMGLPGRMRCGNAGFPYQNSEPAQEKQLLKSRAEALQSELDVIRKRLSEVEAST